MTYAQETIRTFRTELAAVPAIADRIIQTVTAHPFKTEAACEFALQGLLRRVKTLRRCIGEAFRLIPPGRRKAVDSLCREKTEIYLQSYFINIAGSLDNLAWIWVHERGLKKVNGKPLSRSEVGFRKTQVAVRRSVPPSFASYLDSIEPWALAGENYRDALAHRIPLYIPPFSVLISNVEEHRRLEAASRLAQFRAEHEASADFEKQRGKLEFFQAVMMHSYSEGAIPMLFHAQMIADLKTIDELTRRLFAEL
ncbi:hypothetical protein [Mesorhizobium sp. Mes31]|uniref:hypothetical protein n=1 Tax=Mesorhizobium sp. Mes31 TaxID=2926017 RepID=UPI002118A45B|nr:hypothetical protein [Mesorhizobium sp. Mes31]